MRQPGAARGNPGKPIISHEVRAPLNAIKARDGKTPKRTSRLNGEMASQMPMRILVAEDNRVSQHVVMLMLQHMGYSADLAANGKKAFKALRQNGYDVVLMDSDMPEMDGMEATCLVRRDLSRLEQPQIVAVTANALAGDRERYLSVGMDDYVSKPISAEKLVSALQGCYARLNRCGRVL